MKLVVLAGAKEGTEISLKKSPFVVGRASECTLRVKSDAVSRRHCAFVRQQEGFSLRDLGSRNGTYVNGEQISAEVKLADGDIIRIGTLKLQVVDLVPSQQSQQLPNSSRDKKNVPLAEGNGGEIEEDISRWLLGGDSEITHSKETQSFRMDETHTFVQQPTVAQTAQEGEEAQTADPDATAGEQQASTEPKKPGKLPPMAPKKGAKDSGEAAAEILREMARRR